MTYNVFGGMLNPAQSTITHSNMWAPQHRMSIIQTKAQTIRQHAALFYLLHAFVRHMHYVISCKLSRCIWHIMNVFCHIKRFLAICRPSGCTVVFSVVVVGVCNRSQMTTSKCIHV